MELDALKDNTEDNMAQIAPALDEAINQLGAEDRNAIMLRFFERYDFRSVGQALGANEDAARMRVSRALGKLQFFLRQRNVTISVAALGAALAGDSLTAAPAGLASTVSAAALASAKTGGGILLNLISLMTRTQTSAAVAAILIFGLATGIHLVTRSLRQGNTPEERSVQPEALPEVPAQQHGPMFHAGGMRELPSGPSSEIRDAIANLWQALHEDPLDDDGNASPHKVAAALRAFGSDVGLAIPTLLDGLQETNDTVKMCSRWGLGGLGREAERAIPDLLALAQARTQPLSTRVFAVQALGTVLGIASRQSPPDAAVLTATFPQVMNLLQDEDVGLRRDTVGALGQMGSFAKGAVPALTGLLAYSASAEDGGAATTKCMRISTVAVLQGIGQEAGVAIPQLATLLSDPDLDVRAKAAIALWRIAGRTDGAPVLIQAIYPPNPNPDFLEWVGVLGEMGPAATASVPTLQALCKFKEGEGVRESALEALSKIDPATATALQPARKTQ